MNDMDVHELRSPAHPRTTLALYCFPLGTRRDPTDPIPIHPRLHWTLRVKLEY
jgi:hypothetical protein